MVHISTLPPERAEGALAQTYEEIRAAFGHVPQAFQLYSLSPELLAQQWAFIGYFVQHPSLSGEFLAFLRLCVSSEIRCPYCVGLNGGMLIHHYGWSAEQLAEAKRDPQAAPLSAREKALLAYCVAAVRTMGQVEPARLAELRGLGWSERDIFDAVLHAARNVAADILFNTFGLEQEPAR